MSKLDGVSNKRVESDKAFEILVRQSHRHLLAYALSLVRQVSDAEDIVQDAFVVAYRKLAEFDVSRDFGSWMRGIIRLKYLEWARSRKEIIADNETLESIEQAHVLWAEAGADGRADALQALRECIAKLADGVQQAVHLFYMENQSCSAIATVFGVNEVTVYKRLQRARDELTDCVKSQVSVVTSRGNP